MSPIPPEKNADKSEEKVNASSSSDTSGLTTNGDADPTAESNGTNAEHAYSLIPDGHTNATAKDSDDDDDDDDEEEEESDEEIDDDFHFQLLASSRVTGNSQQPNATARTDSQNILEMDVFVKKETLACENIELDETKSTTIVNLMANFQLPESAVPQWARLVPEDVWKQNLLDSLSAKKTDLFHDQHNSNKKEDANADA